MTVPVQICVRIVLNFSDLVIIILTCSSDLLCVEAVYGTGIGTGTSTGGVGLGLVTKACHLFIYRDVCS
jgi:hypothetical protein